MLVWLWSRIIFAAATLLFTATGYTSADGRQVDALTPYFETPTGTIRTWQASENSPWVVYIADQDVDGRYDLYAASTLEPDSDRRLNSPSSKDEHPQVDSFKISPDGSRVVFLGTQDDRELRELYSVPIDGSSSPVKLNGTLIKHPTCNGFFTCARVEGDFEIAPDSSTVTYRAIETETSMIDVYTVPIDGSSGSVRINGTRLPNSWTFNGLAISPDGMRVIYRSNAADPLKIELFSAPRLGGTQPSKLNGTLVAGGNVNEGNTTNLEVGFRISPDSQWVIYRADQEIDERYELYAVPIDGSAPAHKLNQALVSNGDVTPDFPYQIGNSYSIDASNQWVVYRADALVDEKIELFVARIDGSVGPISLNPPFSDNRDVLNFTLSPDGSLVAFVADVDVENKVEIFSVPIDGSGSAIKRNPTLQPGGAVAKLSFQFSPDSARLFFIASEDPTIGSHLYVSDLGLADIGIQLSQSINSRSVIHSDWMLSEDGSVATYRMHGDLDNIYEVYSVVTNGSQGQIQLSDSQSSSSWGGVQEAAFSHDQTQIIFWNDQSIANLLEIYRAPVGIPESSTKVSGEIVTGGSVSSKFVFTPNSSRVIYQADQRIDGVTELFTVPVDASASALRLSGDLVEDNWLMRLSEISPDSSRVIYHADQDVANQIELYSAPADGSGPPIKLNGSLVPLGDADSSVLSPDGQWVFYNANQENHILDELYQVSIIGGTPTKISPPLGVGGDVRDLPRFTSDGLKYIYQLEPGGGATRKIILASVDGSSPQIQINTGILATTNNVGLSRFALNDTYGIFSADPDGDFYGEIYAAPLDGISAPYKLNDTLQQYGSASVLDVSSDGQYVIYSADRDINNSYELFSVRVTGGVPPVKLNIPLESQESIVSTGIEPNTGFIVYLKQEASGYRKALYRTRHNGTSTPVLLSTPIPGTGEIGGFFFTPDGQSVIFSAKSAYNEPYTFFRVPISATTSQVPIDTVLEDGTPLDDLRELRFTPDGSRFIFIAKTPDGIDELFSMSSSWLGPPVRISSPQNVGEGVDNYQLSPNSVWAVYRSDEIIEREKRLYSVFVDQDADGESDLIDIDIDGDDLSNTLEEMIGTSLYAKDSDGDGLSDYDELNYDGNPDDYAPASDTNPNDSDSDGDGFDDGIEINNGSNPLDGESIPEAKILQVPWPTSFTAILAFLLALYSLKFQTLARPSVK